MTSVTLVVETGQLVVLSSTHIYGMKHMNVDFVAPLLLVGDEYTPWQSTHFFFIQSWENKPTIFLKIYCFNAIKPTSESKHPYLPWPLTQLAFPLLLNIQLLPTPSKPQVFLSLLQFQDAHCPNFITWQFWYEKVGGAQS